MRLSEILLEYKRDITKQKLGQNILNVARRENITDIDKVLDSLEGMDPTKNKQYVQWLARQYISGQFRLEDYPRVNDVLVKFENAKRRMQQRDINQYTFRSLEDEIDKIYNVDLEKDSKDVKTGAFTVVPNSDTLYNGPLGQLAIPKTEEASCELGRGTKWCTAASNNNAFKHYSKKGPLYVWRDKNGEKYQFYFGSEPQFMDSRDIPIDNEKLSYFRNKHPVLSKVFKKEEGKILKNPIEAFRYRQNVIKGPWPEADEMIDREVKPLILKAGRFIENLVFDGTIRREFYSNGDEAIKEVEQQCLDAAKALENMDPHKANKIFDFSYDQDSYVNELVRKKFGFYLWDFGKNN